MSKKLLLTVAFLSTSLFANEMLIKQDLSIVAKVPPTTFSSTIQVLGSDKLQKQKNLSLEDKNSIIKTYNTLNAFVKNSAICKGGSFSITPLYEYKNGKRDQVGFESAYHLGCEFKEESKEDFNAILDFIERETQKNPYLLFPIPSVNKNITQEDLREIEGKLNAELIKKANTMAKEYSKTTDKKCTIKEISLGEDSTPAPILRRATLAAAKSTDNALEDISMPTAKDYEKTARAKVVFSCK